MYLCRYIQQKIEQIYKEILQAFWPFVAIFSTTLAVRLVFVVAEDARSFESFLGDQTHLYHFAN